VVKIGKNSRTGKFMTTETNTVSQISNVENSNDSATTDFLAKAESLGYAKIGKDLIVNHVSPAFYDILGLDSDIEFLGESLDIVLEKTGLADQTDVKFDNVDPLQMLREHKAIEEFV